MDEQGRKVGKKHYFRAKFCLFMSPKLKAFFDFMWKKRTLYVLFGMLIAFAIILLIIATPLCVYLPGYLDVHKRAVVMDFAMRIDSLERECDLRLAYLDNMTNILRDRVKPDQIVPYDSAVTRIQDTLLTASERENEFVNRYAQQERFGLNALDEERNGRLSVVFLAPVKGTVAQRDYGEDAKPGATRVALAGISTVLAPLEGDVVSVVTEVGGSYQIVLQHQLEYLTVYSHLKSVMVELGQHVKAGKVIGHAGSKKDTTDCWVGLEVWHKGKSIDPELVMILE